MEKRNRAPTKASQWRRLLALMLCAAAVALAARESSGHTDAQESGERAAPSEEKLAGAGAQPAPYQVDDVPYAVRADALFVGLAHRDDTNLRAWARNRGLDPDGAAVQELRALAQDVASVYGAGIAPRQSAEELRTRFAGDEERFLRWQREQWDNRFRDLGAAFGQWLEARKQNGYPPVFLIERLLNNLDMGVSAASTDSQEALEESLEADARAFEEGLRMVMDSVPPQFLTHAEEDR